MKQNLSRDSHKPNASWRMFPLSASVPRVGVGWCVDSIRLYYTGIQCLLLVGLSLAAYRIAIKLMVLNASNVDVAHMTFG